MMASKEGAGVGVSWLQHHLQRGRRQREGQDKPQKWGR